MAPARRQNDGAKTNGWPRPEKERDNTKHPNANEKKTPPRTPAAYLVREVGVDTHARRDGQRHVGQEAHHEAADGRADARRGDQRALDGDQALLVARVAVELAPGRALVGPGAVGGAAGTAGVCNRRW